MAVPSNTGAVDTRKKYVEAWNKTMVSIWKERIYKLGIRDTDDLYRSPSDDTLDADKRYFRIDLGLSYLEYGLWQELGVGRNTKKGNTHKVDKDGFVNKRSPRHWFSPKYYLSALNMRDFMADSIGDEFIGLFAQLDPELMRSSTNFYRDKGYS